MLKMMFLKFVDCNPFILKTVFLKILFFFLQGVCFWIREKKLSRRSFCKISHISIYIHINAVSNSNRSWWEIFARSAAKEYDSRNCATTSAFWSPLHFKIKIISLLWFIYLSRLYTLVATDTRIIILLDNGNV